MPYERAWIVAFIDPPNRVRTWYDFFTRPGFRHVIAFCYDPGNDCWLLVDPSYQGLNIDIIPTSDMENILIGIRAMGIIVDVPAIRRRRFKFPLVPLIYCVPVIQRIIGVSGFIFTPWQLFGALTKMEGAHIFEARHELEGSGA